MTKLSKKFLSILLIMVVALCVTNVYAEPTEDQNDSLICTSEKKAQLIREAQNVKASYVPHVEICYPGDKCHEDAKKDFIGEDGEMHGDLPYGITSTGEEGYLPYVNDIYLEIDVYNVSENFYVKLHHTRASAGVYPQQLNYSDFKNNKYSFEFRDIDRIGKFTFKVYGTAKSGCEDVLLRTITLEHPKGNEHYQVVRCEGLEDYYLCQPFISVDISNLSAAKVWQMVEEEKTIREENKNKDKDKNTDNKKLYLYIFAATAAGVGLIVVGTVLLKKKRR